MFVSNCAGLGNDRVRGKEGGKEERGEKLLNSEEFSMNPLESMGFENFIYCGYALKGCKFNRREI